MMACITRQIGDQAECRSHDAPPMRPLKGALARGVGVRAEDDYSQQT